MSFGLTLEDVAPVELALYFDNAQPLDSSSTPDLGINARNLHAYLDVGKHFASWITDRISELQLVEYKDFEVFPNFGKNPKGGRPSKEYYLTLEAAEEICMGEGNAKGKQARKYYIQCRKELMTLRSNGTTTVQIAAERLLTDPKFTLQLVGEYANRIVTLEGEKAILEPKAKVADLITNADHSNRLLTDAAKVLGVGPRFLVDLLLNKLKWCYRRGNRPQGTLIPYQAILDQGLMYFKEEPREVDHGTRSVTHRQSYITPKGLTKLAKLFT